MAKCWNDNAHIRPHTLYKQKHYVDETYLCKEIEQPFSSEYCNVILAESVHTGEQRYMSLEDVQGAYEYDILHKQLKAFYIFIHTISEMKWTKCK